MKIPAIFSRASKVALLVLVLALSFLISACAANYGSKDYVRDEFPRDEHYNEYDTGEDGFGQTVESTGQSNLSARKMIFTASMTIETLEYEKSLENLEKLVAEYGGFIQDSQIQTETKHTSSSSSRTSYFTIRIPSEKLNDFRKAGGGIGKILTNNISGEDVSEVYFDSEARVQNLRVQEERILELLTKADNLADILLLENQLNEVRDSIEILTGKLQKMDALVSMSTVEITLYEVKTLTEAAPESFGQKIAQTFKGSIEALTVFLKGMVLALVAVAPFLLPAGIIFLLIFIPIYRAKKKRKNQKNK